MQFFRRRLTDEQFIERLRRFNGFRSKLAVLMLVLTVASAFFNAWMLQKLYDSFQDITRLEAAATVRSSAAEDIRAVLDLEFALGERFAFCCAYAAFATGGLAVSSIVLLKRDRRTRLLLAKWDEARATL